MTIAKFCPKDSFFPHRNHRSKKNRKHFMEVNGVRAKRYKNKKKELMFKEKEKD